MPKLTADMQVVIVTELACFRRNAEVAETLKRDFSVTVDVRHIETYNPLRPGKKPAKKWCDLFAETRANFIAERSAIPITHHNVRQRERDDALYKAKKQGNMKLVIEILREAAQEEGEMFTNHRAKEPVAATEEQKIASMRNAFREMDVQTIGEPTTPPSLGLVQGGSA